MVAYLTKSDASEGFNQIIDYLSGSLIKKKVVVTEVTIRNALCLDDAEGVKCLPNEEIFAELARMGYEKPSTKLTFYKAFFSSQWKFLIRTILQCMSAKRTSWNEFSSLMASDVICLSTGRKFNFSKYIFDSLVAEEGDDNENVEDVNAGNAAEGDVNAADDEVPTADEEPSIPSPTPPTPPPQPSQDIPSTSHDARLPMDLLQNLLDTCTTLTRRVEHLELDKVAQTLEITKLKQRVKKLERRNKMIAEIDKDDDVVLEEAKDVADDIIKDVQNADVEESAHDQGRQAESQAKIYKIDLEHANKVLSMQEDEYEPSEVQEVVDVVTTAKIITEEPKTLKKQAQIEQDEQYAKKLEAELNKNIDWDEVIDHVNKKAKEDPVVKRYQALKRKPQTEAQARKNMMIYLKNVACFKMDYFKRQKNKLKKKRAELKRINETPAEKAIKMQKLDEEVEELKRHLQIVPNEEDDVYTEATPLALKVPIVDYQIYNENNKPYYIIKRADGSHQLYLSFLSLLRNFDREDLEDL
nr:synaptobrevin, longin-like domain protein [Tanacetum cinerariifolium]